MPVPMCFGRASLVSQKSGLDPGKLLAGHSTRSNPWVHLNRPVAQDAVWGRSPSLRSRILNTRRVSPQGTARAAHKHGALETPQFSQCFPKQTGSVSSDSAHANGVHKDFIHSCRFTPSEKSPSQRHLQADLDVALAAWTAQPLFSAASLHKPAPQALVALLLCSPSPSQETCMCKQSQGVFTMLPAPTGHTHTFLYQTAETEVKTDSNICNLQEASPSLLLATKQSWEEQPEPNPGTSLFSFNVN